MHRKLISAAVLTLIGLSALPVGASAAARPGAALAQGQITTQLPRNAVPSHYAVSLTPDAAAATFSASVTIALDLRQRSSSITLNAADLAFSRAAISAGPGQPARPASRIAVDEDRQTVTLHFAAPLAAGNYQLKLDYSGKIGSQASGLFSLDYDNAQGRQRALYTQFENSDARRMIPSWDEPGYKATFALEVTLPGQQMAVSNMPISSSTDLADGRKRVRFATTPRMSTYLLFFAAGDFERATVSESGVELGVITQRGALPQARFALDASAAILREFNDYFGVPYPLPKLDNIAAPGRSQFFDAMENWGAIFSFEQALLLDPRISTQSDKEAVFLTAAHEMAHQWFGDLVTMAWWDDLWLNEGFASWMESRTTARLHPEWNSTLAAVDVRERAMERDAMATTHPVVQHVATVEQASQAFDSITYAKGEAVIRMLENHVGENAWREGVRAYMRQHAYGSTVSDDLWRLVEKAAKQPITAIAHDFTLRAGVPLISISEAVCRNGSTRLKLVQGEYAKDQPGKKPGSWRVPVVAQTVGGTPVRTVVAGGRASLTVPGCGAVLLNAGQAGYYRTLYQPTLFKALAADFGKLAAIDQLGVMADSWSLGLAGMQDASSFLTLAQATPLSADSQVWGRTAATFSAINRQYQGDEARRQRFTAFAIARLTPVMAQTGWIAKEGEAQPLANLREELISTLSALGDPAVIAEARRRYALRASDPAALPAALRRVILAVVARHADSAGWDELRAEAKAEKSALIRRELYDLLASVDDAALARRALELSISEEPGATNSAAMLNAVALRHPDLAFDFALAHLEQVNAMVDASSRSRYFPGLGGGSADPAMRDKLRAYAKAHLPAGADGDVKTAIASIGYRIQVRQQRLPQIDAWLAAH
ncbi:M1 family metallopeptidase [Oxalobacteraceae bacterium]|nr:M1 family metallopeptidase [Oxalobacteraceae bacterium]